MRILGRWLINSLILFILPYILPGISVSGFGSALAMALVLGLINAFLKPVLKILSLPITLITFGFSILIINTFLFWLASKVVRGYNLVNLLTAFLASFLFSLAATFLRRVV
jgi:putative membrane protein